MSERSCFVEPDNKKHPKRSGLISVREMRTKCLQYTKISSKLSQAKSNDAFSFVQSILNETRIYFLLATWHDFEVIHLI